MTEPGSQITPEITEDEISTKLTKVLGSQGGKLLYVETDANGQPVRFRISNASYTLRPLGLRYRQATASELREYLIELLRKEQEAIPAPECSENEKKRKRTSRKQQRD